MTSDEWVGNDSYFIWFNILSSLISDIQQILLGGAPNSSLIIRKIRHLLFERQQLTDALPLHHRQSSVSL